MRTISLAELTTRAALLTRVDRKYVLPADELPALFPQMDAVVLEIDGRREFGYRSVYYDTPELAGYLGAAPRRPNRFKIRTRTYLDTGLRVLELKTRDGRGSTVKRRLPHEDLHTLATGLGPTLITHYRRRTLFLPGDGSRVTIDTALEWALPDGPRVRLPGRAIVETKCPPGRASAVDRLLRSLHHRPCAISKYATGLAALRAELPANRWKPVLRRHFAEGRES